MDLVKADKLREVKAGHDGTWAAHPGLIELVTKVFNENMAKSKPNQMDERREDVKITDHDLLQMPRGTRTLEGLRLNTRVGIQYIAAWLSGLGSVPLYNLMEDAATAEISRVQNWQWIKYEAVLDGEAVPLKVTKQLFAKVKLLMAFPNALCSNGGTRSLVISFIRILGILIVRYRSCVNGGTRSLSYIIHRNSRYLVSVFCHSIDFFDMERWIFLMALKPW